MHRLGVLCLSAAVLSTLAGCGGESASKPPAPTLRFRLASAGLPMDGQWKSAPVIADFNQDGFQDIAGHSRLATGPGAWLGNGKGQWTDSSATFGKVSSCGGGLAVGDVNKDGKLDLAVADHCAGVYVFLGDGQGRWQAATERLQPDTSRTKSPRGVDNLAVPGAESIAIGDVDEDGSPDLVVSSTDQGGLTVYLGDGSGRKWKERKASGLPNGEAAAPGDAYYGGFATALRLVDMNGDGHLDVVAAYYTGARVWWGDGKGHFEDHSQGLIKTVHGGIYGRVAVADINGDGRPDLAVSNIVNGVEVYLQNADGSWKGPIDPMPELKEGARAVALCDVDGDGNVDVVLAGMKNRWSPSDRVPWGLFVRFGDGKGGFTASYETNLPQTGQEVIWGVACADVNGDGRMDLVVSTGGISSSPMDRSGPSGQPPGPGKGAADGAGDASTSAGAPAERPAFPHLQVWLNEGVAGR